MECAINEPPYGECSCKECQDYESALHSVDTDDTCYQAIVSILKETGVDKIKAIGYVESMIELGVLKSDAERAGDITSNALQKLFSISA